ncbi:hypothetical protein PI124_g15230 [Phytophthora idaei]|nr:hypothetical protein PI124_g15230 [Phytophthora idaei]
MSSHGCSSEGHGDGTGERPGGWASPLETETPDPAEIREEEEEASILDFDEELLPEDSWQPDHLAGEFEIEAILDDTTPLMTTTKRTVRCT